MGDITFGVEISVLLRHFSFNLSRRPRLGYSFMKSEFLLYSAFTLVLTIERTHIEISEDRNTTQMPVRK
jgi:hypothetical protein